MNKLIRWTIRNLLMGPVNLFNDDHCIINYQSNGSRYCSKCHDIKCITYTIQNDNCEEESYRNRNQYGSAGPEGSEKQNSYQDSQNQTYPEAVIHTFYCPVNKICLIIV